MDNSKKIEEIFSLMAYQQISRNTLAGPSAGRDITKHGVIAGHMNNHKFGTFAGNQMSKTFIPSTRKYSSELPLDFKLPSAFSVPTLPLLQANYDPEIELMYCELEGVRIPGFVVGGEERLCLPQIIRNILLAKQVDTDTIHNACHTLLIHCARCTAHQLRLLKEKEILPLHVQTAGLIRKTDAERLCTTLLHSKLTPITNPDSRAYPEINNTCIPVYHECFGEGHGFFYTELYNHSQARCISCADCEKLFTPERFITHSHYNQENEVIHWGFNRRNWRSYLLLSDDDICDEDLSILDDVFQQAVDKFKNSNFTKRKQVDVRSESIKQIHMSSFQPISANSSTSIKRRCNRPPMKSYKYVKEEPKVENPEAVVSSDDKHLYNEHFVPNICLKNSSSSCSSPEEAFDNVTALDLRSPPIRQRHSSSATRTSEVKVMMECAPAENQSTEEILDVESSDEPESMVVVQDRPAEGQSKVVSSYIESMRGLFTDVLQRSDLSDSEKETKRIMYNEYIAQMSRALI